MVGRWLWQRCIGELAASILGIEMPPTNVSVVEMDETATSNPMQDYSRNHATGVEHSLCPFNLCSLSVHEDT